LPLTVRRNTKQAPHYNGPIRDYDGPVKLEVVGLPRGVTVKPAVIGAGDTSGELVFTAGAEAPRQPFEIAIIGEGKRDDGTVLRRIAERRLYLAEPASAHLPWNWRSRKVVCVVAAQ
jgi:hypothetical protein